MPIILKHELRGVVDKRQKVSLTVGCKIIKVDFQGPKICMWAIHHGADYPVDERTFVIVPTGLDTPHVDFRTYLGTVQDGMFVWHVFEVMEKGNG